MTAPDLQGLVQFFTERLLNTAAAGVVLVVLVWVFLRLIGRQSSGTRFAVWFSTLLTVVALPFFSGPRLVESHLLHGYPAIQHSPILLSSSFGSYLFIAWAIGAGLMLMRLSVGFWRLRHFRNQCSDLDLAGFDPAVVGVLRDFESSRSVRLCVSGDVAVPVAIGFLRPAIVFPASLLPQLSSVEIEIILLHELAHLRRWDDWTSLGQKIVKALFFFHPAVWWIENRLTLEREMACDDMVLAQTANPREYASSLISFAEKVHGGRGLGLAQALVSRMHQMSLRVAQILDPKRPHRHGLWSPALGLSAGVLALAVASASYMPKLVAFGEQPNRETSVDVELKQRAVRPVGRAGEASVIRTGTEPIALRQAGSRPRRAAQARVIPAALHTPNPAIPLKLKAPSHLPVLIHTRIEQEEIPIQQTIVILRTRQYDASGYGVWTLCIWKVGNGSSGDRQLEQAIFVGLI